MKRQSKTIIAAIKNRQGKIIMASDRRVSYDWDESFECPYPKIKKFSNGCIVGASGDSGLCKLFTCNAFTPPPINTNDLDIYMYFKFIPALTNLLKCQVGYQDEHGVLRIAADEMCSLLVAVRGSLFTIDILNPEDGLKEYCLSRVVLDDAPIPFAIGCGRKTTLPLLKEAKKEKGYNTKEDLFKAIRAACEVSPGCGLENNTPDWESE